MKKFIRKIRKVSTHSYAVVLPKELVKKFGWKERQKVELIFGGRKHDILIRDWRPTGARPKGEKRKRKVS